MKLELEDSYAQHWIEMIMWLFQWRYLVPVIDLYSFIFQKVLETNEIIIRDIAGESSVAEWYHRVSPMQGLWKSRIGWLKMGEGSSVIEPWKV